LPCANFDTGWLLLLLLLLMLLLLLLCSEEAIDNHLEEPRSAGVAPCIVHDVA
jgi:hypothetical protein